MTVTVMTPTSPTSPTGTTGLTGTTHLPGCAYTVVRNLPAPVGIVWDLWTSPEHVAAWFHAPRHTVALDVRTGGSWAATMIGPDGSANRLTGGFEEVVEQQHIVATIDVPFTPEPAVISVSFTARGGRTLVVVDQVCDSPAERVMAERGATVLLDWFAAHVAARRLRV